MGNDESHEIDSAGANGKSLSVEELGAGLKDGKYKRVVVMTGAGISTSAGIPDFRSPDTGLYANLARLNLPYPEAVFNISFFRQNPLPFYTLAHEIAPGKYRPTITHSFIKLLENKNILLKHFTQNIDTLDRKAGVSGEKIVEAHGSFADQHCIECGTGFPEDKMRKAIEEKVVPRCERTKCDGLVKPDIVFFGEALPREFFMNRGVPGEADLCIIMGSSLTVHPFASLPELTPRTTPRLLINNEQVGSLGHRPNDTLLLGDCDAQVRKLADAAGWLDELEELWDGTALEPAWKDKDKDRRKSKNAKNKKKGDFGYEEGEKQLSVEDKDRNVKEQVDALTREIDKSLKVTENKVNEPVPERPLTQKQPADGSMSKRADESPTAGASASASASGDAGEYTDANVPLETKDSAATNAKSNTNTNTNTDAEISNKNRNGGKI